MKAVFVRIALVHDWLIEIGDREKVFLDFAELFPGADVFTLAYNRELFEPLLGFRKVQVSALQSITGGSRAPLGAFPLFGELMGRMDLSEYDLVISSSSVCAKWVKTSSKTLHVCYCHSPFPSAWGLPDPLFDPFWFSPSRWPGRSLSGYLQWQERRSNLSVKHFMASSTDVQTLIKSLYGRDSEVFFPPVETERFARERRVGERFLLVVDARPVPRVLKAVRALRRIPVPLTLWVKGDNAGHWQRASNVTTEVLLGKDLPLEEVLSQAKALICLDEGKDLLVAAQALAAGCPLWVEEKVLLSDILAEGETGTRFGLKTLSEDLERFSRTRWDTDHLRKSVNRFSRARFLFKAQVYFRRLFGIATQMDNEKL